MLDSVAELLNHYPIYYLPQKRAGVRKWSGKDITALCPETEREFSSRRTFKKRERGKKKKHEKNKRTENLTMEFPAIILRKETELSEDDQVSSQGIFCSFHTAKNNKR